MLKLLFKIFIFSVISTSVCWGKDIAPDSLYVIKNDSVQMNKTEKIFKISNRKNDTTTLKKFKPDPVKVLWMGAIIPGYGQILNHSYWKLPIVYAGFLGCIYAVSWNSRRYENYRSAYIDINDDIESTKSYLDILPPGVTIDTYPNGMAGLKTNLTTFYQQSRRYRDLSIIGSVAFYGITLLEAFVDAQLFDFDISTDLSLHIRPSLLDSNYGVSKSAGLQLSFKLK